MVLVDIRSNCDLLGLVHLVRDIDGLASLRLNDLIGTKENGARQFELRLGQVGSGSLTMFEGISLGSLSSFLG